ncbi:MAG: aldehyde-activating protein [Pelagibacterium sp. SCN 64-44]|nr:MAG: aldehyde-activating protein [Pelagibacterium sp. SCN 64-44]
MPRPEAHSGGCQCGAVRFRIARLGRSSICHCRMCQKAFGGFFGPLVTGLDFAWTRGAPKYFASSDTVRRGFCGECGTPLTYESGHYTEFAIGALDDPEVAAPVLQVNPAGKLSFTDHLHDLPTWAPEKQAERDALYAGYVSRQHPDHDTPTWPPKEQA